MVNTFIVGDFLFTAKVLDNRRKLKQAVEAKQIISIIMSMNSTTSKTSSTTSSTTSSGFRNHPAVIMWKPYLPALILYYNTFVKCLIDNNFKLDKLTLMPLIQSDSSDFTKTEDKSFDEFNIEMPWFVNFMPMIYSHRARLYQKDPIYYKDKFEFPEEYLSLGYIWPSRKPKEFYLNEKYEISEIADKLDKKYLNSNFCKAILKTGIKKGQECMNNIKDNNKYCGIHKKYDK